MKAEKVIQHNREEQKLSQNQIRDVASYFHDNQGELFLRSEAVENISDELELDVPEHLTHKSFINQLIGDLVGDHVDPIQLVDNADGKYVGIIEYEEHGTYYTYDEYHDIEDLYKRAVCAACIHQSAKSSEPFTRHTGNFGEYPYRDESELHKEMSIHVETVHSGENIDVETGATLASGTTIAGNTSFHAGNDGPASGLSADDVDGSEPPFANSDLNNDTVTVAGKGVALGGSTVIDYIDLNDTSESFPIPNSDLSNSVVTVNTGTDISGGGSISLGGSITINHGDTSAQGDVSTNGATVIDDIGVDGRGHIDNINTQNRSLDDWGDANANIGFGQNKATDLQSIEFSNQDVNSLGARELAFNDTIGGAGVAGGFAYKDSGNNTVWMIGSDETDYTIVKNGSDGPGLINFKT